MSDPALKKKSRPPLLVANWKMHKTIAEAKQFVETLAPLLDKSQLVYLAVPFTALATIAADCKALPVSVGAQNMHDEAAGAFTGEVSAQMLKEAGASFVIVGHSERRRLFHEDNAFIARKVRRALIEGLRPILCIGETQEERDNNLTQNVLREQLTACLEGVLPEEMERLTLAYEPVWAIGTGKVATAKDVKAAHGFCRDLVAKKWGREVAAQLPLLYGGSVKPEGVQELIVLDDVDGFLVGGASLSPIAFSEIIKQSSKLVL